MANWLTRLCVLALAGSFIEASLATETPDDAKREVTQAWEFMRLGRWNDADAILQRLKQSGEEEIVCNAWFAEGNLWQHRRPGPDPERAAKSYRWVLDHYPQDTVAPWTLLALARIPDLDVLTPRPEESIPIYQRVMSDYPGSNAAQEAALYLAEALWQARGKAGAAEGVKELERWKAEHPNPKYDSIVELLLGKLYRYPLEDFPAAVNHLRTAFDLGLHGLAQRASTCWTIADLAETELKDRSLAVSYYTLFLQKFPLDKRAFMAKKALQRLGAPVPEVENSDLGGMVKP